MYLNVDDLVEQGLVVKKTYTEGKYKGLSVLKYHKKVFYNNLWHLDERLLDCRGTVVDENNKVIVLPFKKVFNLGENNTSVPEGKPVQVIEKKNGFMCAVTYTDKYGLIVSTTGSLDSSYVELAKKWVDTLSDAKYSNNTLIFEICDEDDPHIVEEEEGMYLIGCRSLLTGRLYPEPYLEGYAESLCAKRPKVHNCIFKDIDFNVSHEGFMIRDFFTWETLCKVKSKHYLSKKAMMRLGKKNINMMYDNTESFRKRLDEEFYDILDYIVNNVDKEVWSAYTELERRNFIEEYFNG